MCDDAIPGQRVLDAGGGDWRSPPVIGHDGRGRVCDVSHVAIGVRDMELALAFYRDVLGLVVDFDEIEVIPRGNAAPLRRRGAYLRWSLDPTAPFLVLDQLLDEDRAGQPKRALEELGIHHFCFRVEDLDAVVTRARDAGVEVPRDPVVAGTRRWGLPDGGEVKSVFLADPDGNAVQLDEFLSLPAAVG